MFSYRSWLKQALSITWKHKYLWFFGLFASLTAAGGSWEYQFLSQNLNKDLVNNSYSQLINLAVVNDLAVNFWHGLISLLHYDIWTILNIISLLTIIFLITASIIWLAISSQAALINNVKNTAESKKRGEWMTIQGGLTIGHQYFWPTLALNILMKISILAIFSIISLPLLLMSVSTSNNLAIIYVILFVIFIPLAAGLALIIKYAIAYTILDDYSLVKSIEKGWHLFKKNWLVSLEAATLLFIFNLFAGGIILLALFIAIMPLLLLGIMFEIGWIIFMGIFLAIAIIILGGSFLTTFQITSWTDLFLRLKNQSIIAKLERLFKR
ncbi:MAG: hypothetical protein WC146_00935 [Patescibacteria group bacterium]|jgi:hypothetical protein